MALYREYKMIEGLILKNKIIKILIYIMGMLFLWFTIHTIIITIDGLNDEIKVSDVVTASQLSLNFIIYQGLN